MHGRKRPTAPRAGVAAGDGPRTIASSAGATGDGRTRSERSDAEARAKLSPLAPGERPAAVTAAAVLAVAVAVANVGAYVAGAKVGGHRPPGLQIVAFSGVALALAAGMWRNRYWAVLTFEALLAIAMLVFAILLMIADNLQAAVECVAVIALSGTLFWYLVRAMGRIQLTERAPRE